MSENEIDKLLFERFNFQIDLNYVIGKDKYYLCSPELAELEFRGIQRKGMIAFKLNTLFGTKPTLDFILIYGYLAKKNFIVFSEEEIKTIYEGKDLEKNCGCEDGLVIVKNQKGNGIGLVFKKENVLKTLIPKNRMIR